MPNWFRQFAQFKAGSVRPESRTDDPPQSNETPGGDLPVRAIFPDFLEAAANDT